MCFLVIQGYTFYSAQRTQPPEIVPREKQYPQTPLSHRDLYTLVANTWASILALAASTQLFPYLCS